MSCTRPIIEESTTASNLETVESASVIEALRRKAEEAVRTIVEELQTVEASQRVPPATLVIDISQAEEDIQQGVCYQSECEIRCSTPLANPILQLGDSLGVFEETVHPEKS